MKKILLIATGGTIASGNTESGLTPTISGEELLKSVPGLKNICEPHAIQVLNLDSTDMTPADWLVISGAIERYYDEYDGFVVAHGTDTMAYTAAALSYLVRRSPKPIVLTGAQKPIHSENTDSQVNLLDAFAYGDMEKDELVLLDMSLREIARWGGYTGIGYDSPENLWGSVLWMSGFTGSREIRFLDLRDGRAWKTPLEIPTWVRAVLPDGRILGMNEKWSALTIFDREGKVVSRCSVPGSMSLVRTEKDRICFAEWRGPDTHGFVYDELFDETTTHVWRLDPVK